MKDDKTSGRKKIPDKEKANKRIPTDFRRSDIKEALEVIRKFKGYKSRNAYMTAMFEDDLHLYDTVLKHQKK